MKKFPRKDAVSARISALLKKHHAYKLKVKSALPHPRNEHRWKRCLFMLERREQVLLKKLRVYASGQDIDLDWFQLQEAAFSHDLDNLGDRLYEGDTAQAYECAGAKTEIGELVVMLPMFTLVDE